MNVIAPVRLDRRINAFRPDLAASLLRGQVEAERFVDGTAKQVTAAFATVRGEPDEAARTTTQLLFGERVTVFDEAGGWAWVQNESDGYVGYVPSAALGEPGPEGTHRVSALRSFLFPEPDLKTQPLMALSFWSAVAVDAEENGWARLASGGWISAKQLASAPLHPNPLRRGERGQEGRASNTPLSFREREGEGSAAEPIAQSRSSTPDYPATGLRFLDVPYLWGGRTSLGLDCSALVQLSLSAAGIPCPRDSDMQREALGQPIPKEGPYRRGDLVFFPGHVGIMVDETRMVHANAFHMAVAVEPLADAAARVAITAVRRL